MLDNAFGIGRQNREWLVSPQSRPLHRPFVAAVLYVLLGFAGAAVAIYFQAGAKVNPAWYGMDQPLL